MKPTSDKTAKTPMNDMMGMGLLSVNSSFEL